MPSASRAANAEEAPDERIHVRRSNGETEWVTRRELALLREKRALERRVDRLRQDRSAALALALVGAIVGVIGLTEMLREPAPPATVATPLAASSPAAPSPIGTSAPVEARVSFRPDPPAPEAAPASDHAEREVEDVVRSWAAAWSRQDFGEYASFYSPRFQSSGGLGRASWIEIQRPRILEPEFVMVGLDDLEIVVTAEDAAEARFVQIHHAPGRRDRGARALELAREPGGWKIVAEHEARPSPTY